MDEIKLILINILNRLERIEEKIDSIEKKQNDIQNSTSHMDNHIQFIENVYDKVKQPLAYATNKLNNLMSYNQGKPSEINLPELKP